jgi:hypothetical protein
MQPFPPVPDLIVTMAEENPENFVRAGGSGATSLMGNEIRGEVEKDL